MTMVDRYLRLVLHGFEISRGPVRRAIVDHYDLERDPPRAEGVNMKCDIPF
jgi:hypothetical protein